MSSDGKNYREALYACLVQLVKDGHDVDEIIFHQHWDEKMLALFGVHVTDEFVAAALNDVWVEMAAGRTSHAKKYDIPDPNVPGNTDGAMVGSYGHVTGVKDITFRDDNAAKGLPTSFCDAMLRDRDTGRRFYTCEAITASDKRTGWFARAFAIIALADRTGIIGFQVGNGSVGVSCLDFLNLHKDTSKQFTTFNVTARNAAKNKGIVAKLSERMNFALVAVDDHTALREGAQLLITAASGDVAVVKTEDVPDDCHILSQGRFDLEPSLIQKRYEMDNHVFVGDNFKAMDERCIDSLAKWAKDKGTTLVALSKAEPHKFLEYATIITNPLAMSLFKHWKAIFTFLPVGLFAYDAAVLVKQHAELRANLLALRN